MFTAINWNLFLALEYIQVSDIKKKGRRKRKTKKKQIKKEKSKTKKIETKLLTK